MGPKRAYDVAFKIGAVEYAMEHSGEKAARHFGVDPKRIRDWRKQYPALQALQQEKGTQRKRVKGGGSKKVSEELEDGVLSWILDQRRNGIRVSRRMIRLQAKIFFDKMTENSKRKETFAASSGWLQKFMARNSLRSGHKTTQDDPDQLIQKLVSFVIFVSNVRRDNSISDDNVIAMDETSVWFNTAEQSDSKIVLDKTSGEEKDHCTVLLSAKGDGTKLKPFIVFRGGMQEVNKLQDVEEAIVMCSKSGWMNDELTIKWLEKICKQYEFQKRLLVWDAYRCHISEEAKNELMKYNVVQAVIPGGCTRYIQAPNVVWSKLFKDKVQERYDEWLAGDAEKEFTKDGNLKSPSRRLVATWIVKAWDDLPKETIVDSFKSCGITNAIDGSEDDLIHCFKDQQPCYAGKEALLLARQQQQNFVKVEVKEEYFEEDYSELVKNEAVISDSESDE